MGSSKAYTVNTTETNTLTANADGTIFAGEGSRLKITDQGAVKSALELAKLATRKAFQFGGAAGQLVDNANKVISSSGATALEQVAAAKTDGGQTERILKIGGFAAVAIAALLLFKR